MRAASDFMVSMRKSKKLTQPAARMSRLDREVVFEGLIYRRVISGFGIRQQCTKAAFTLSFPFHGLVPPTCPKCFMYRSFGAELWKLLAMAISWNRKFRCLFGGLPTPHLSGGVG